jgi:hypothetical protein
MAGGRVATSESGGLLRTVGDLQRPGARLCLGTHGDRPIRGVELRGMVPGWRLSFVGCAV